jgi:hypothetical protein
MPYLDEIVVDLEVKKLGKYMIFFFRQIPEKKTGVKALSPLVACIRDIVNLKGEIFL